MIDLQASGFTPRQAQVLRRIVQGKSNKEIARELGIGEESVKSHAAVVIARCGVKNRVQAAVWGARRGVGNDK